jgi:cellulose synthase/poly-beta-1,6-N-acetylglucosamine synthase-like glycosyltransferase
MKLLFWLSALLIAYTYAGYAAWLWLRSRVSPMPVRRGPHQPAISIVMVVRNEAEGLPAKLKNLLELKYPAELREIIVVSDGSQDKTESVLQSCAEPGLRTVLKPVSRGKASGLNEGVAMARGELVMFTDARQWIEPDALRLMVEDFADPEIGCVSGELMLGDREKGEASEGMGVYWRVEKKIRELESASGSVVGATGALYAIRRELFVPVPEETLLDDVYIPMQVARAGKRVIFEPRARAWDSPDLGAEREFARKVRTLSGNYQLLQLLPWIAGGGNPLRFEFVSHKLLRLAAPFALVILFATSALIAGGGYRLVFFLQIIFYGMGLLTLLQWKLGRLTQAAGAARTFVVLNSAAAVAFANFIAGRKAGWGR